MNKIKEFIKKISGKVVKNVSWILFQNAYTMLLSLILTGIVARHYGTNGYGIINFSSSFVAIFSFIAVFGTNHIIVNDFSQKKYKDGVILGTNLYIRIILSLISLIVSQTVAVIAYDLPTNLAILLFNINVIISSGDIFSFYSQANIQNKYISIAKIISTTIFSVLKLVAVICNLNILLYISTYLIENVIYIILLTNSYKKITNNKNEKWQVDKEYLKYLLKRSKFFALSTLMVTIYLKIDQVMLGTFFNDKSIVGIYSAAVRISEIWTFVPLAVITAFKPIIISSKKVDENSYFNNLRKLYNVVSIVCLAFLIGIIIFGKIGILILYGKDYIDAYIPLVILTFGMCFGVLGNIHYIWMTCENKEKYSLFYSFVGCFINIILNALLISKYSIIGASIATLISQIGANVVAFLLIKETRIISVLLIKSLNPYYGIKEIIKKNISSKV